MENQHRKIKGYKELIQDQIDLINRIKEKEVEIKKLVDDLVDCYELTAEEDPFGQPA